MTPMVLGHTYILGHGYYGQRNDYQRISNNLPMGNVSGELFFWARGVGGGGAPGRKGVTLAELSRMSREEWNHRCPKGIYFIIVSEGARAGI